MPFILLNGNYPVDSSKGSILKSGAFVFYRKLERSRTAPCSRFRDEFGYANRR